MPYGTRKKKRVKSWGHEPDNLLILITEIHKNTWNIYAASCGPVLFFGGGGGGRGGYSEALESEYLSAHVYDYD